MDRFQTIPYFLEIALVNFLYEIITTESEVMLMFLRY
jgi:hypothetical protein